MNIKILITLLIVLFPVVAKAEWLNNGKPVTNSPYAKTDGDFGAKIIFTVKPAELFEAWEKPTEGVSVPEVDKTRRGKPVTVLIMFSNCAADDNGMANVTVDYKVFDPNGELLNELNNLEVWVNRPVLDYRALGLSVKFMAVNITKKYPTGIYMVIADVTDHNSGKTLHLERQLEVTR